MASSFETSDPHANPSDQTASSDAQVVPKERMRCKKRVSNLRKTEGCEDQESTLPGQDCPNLEAPPSRPEVLAQLAVHLLALNPHSLPSSIHGTLSNPRHNSLFQDALKRADFLLRCASGISDDPIYAYQLFAEDEGPLSFEAVADRFKEVGWSEMRSYNTVEKYIKELVGEADEVIREGLQQINARLETNRTYPGGIWAIVARAKRHIRNMIKHTGMSELFSQPNEIADALGQYFQRLAKSQIPGDWQQVGNENLTRLVGYRSFLEYVCAGVSCENFPRGRPPVSLDSDAIHSLVHLLASWPSHSVQDYPTYKSKFKHIVTFASDSGVLPPRVVQNLNSCLEELFRENPDYPKAKRHADEARSDLQKFWKWFNLRNLVQSWIFRDLRILLNRRPESVLSHKRKNSRENLTILDVVDKVSAKAKAEFTPPAVESLKTQLAKLVILLKKQDEPTNVVALKPTSHGKASLPSLTSLAVSLERGLQIKPPTPKRSSENLRNLLTTLAPLSQSQRCRPYELFLFAAQRGLLQDKLIRKHSDLNPDFIPYPKVPDLKVSDILENHKGAEIAAGMPETL